MSIKVACDIFAPVLVVSEILTFGISDLEKVDQCSRVLI